MDTKRIKIIFFHVFVVLATVSTLTTGYFIAKGDFLRLFECYALAFWHGNSYFISHVKDYIDCVFLSHANMFPFHTLPAEYPILSLLMMSPGILGGYKLYDYIFIFSALLCVIALYVLLWKMISVRAALVYCIYIIIGGLSTTAGRLDIFVTLLIFLSLIAATKKKFPLAYILLAFATMFKLFPIFLLIPLFLAEQKAYLNRLSLKRLINVGIYFCICFILFLASVWINIYQAISPAFYHFSRPVQIESVPSSILFGLSSLDIIKTCLGNSYQSVNIFGFYHNECGSTKYSFFQSLSIGISIIDLVLFIGGIFYLSKLFLANKIKIAHFYLGVILLLLCTAKVFSPQFIIWAIPFVAYIYEFDSIWFSWWFIISLLTTIIYPLLYGLTPFLSHLYPRLFQSTIALRNIFLVALTLCFIFNFRRIRDRNQEKMTKTHKRKKSIMQKNRAVL